MSQKQSRSLLRKLVSVPCLPIDIRMGSPGIREKIPPQMAFRLIIPLVVDPKTKSTKCLFLKHRKRLSFLTVSSTRRINCRWTRIASIDFALLTQFVRDDIRECHGVLISTNPLFSAHTSFIMDRKSYLFF